MRWTRVVLLTRALSCGRRSRVVLTPRRWRQVCGQDAASDGGKRADRRGSRRKPLKPLRAGMPGDSGATAVNTRVHSTLPLRTRGCGCTGHPASPTPSLGREVLQDSGASRRENNFRRLGQAKPAKLSIVVPAKAETHNHRRFLLRESRRPAPFTTGDTAYGSRLSPGRRRWLRSVRETRWRAMTVVAL